MREFNSDGKVIRVGRNGIMVISNSGSTSQTKLFPYATLDMSVDHYIFGRSKVTLTATNTKDSVEFQLSRTDIEEMQLAMLNN
jgi:hypothetical protein